MEALIRQISGCQLQITLLLAHVKRHMTKIEKEYGAALRPQQEFLEAT